MTELQHIHSRDIQQLFREWYNGIFPHSGNCCPSEVPVPDEDSIYIHPNAYDLNLSLVHEQYDYSSCLCPHRPYKNPNEDWALQTAIAKTFQEFLDITYTTSPWGLGLDRSLGTNIPSDLVGRERYQQMQQETQYRCQLINSAVHDCLAVTQLSIAIRHEWSRQQLEGYIQQHHIHHNAPGIQPTSNVLVTQPLLPMTNQSTDLVVIHHPEPSNDYEPISDDEVPPSTHTSAPISPSTSSNIDSSTTTEQQVIPVVQHKQRSQEAIRRRCRKRNIIKRVHRHDFDIIRTIYPRFKIQQVEQVLDNLNIRRRHCHIRRHYQLHIGVHSPEDQLRYDHLLENQYFTKKHYDQEFGCLSSSSHLDIVTVHDQSNINPLIFH
jgi:hypothetical protein